MFMCILLTGKQLLGSEQSSILTARRHVNKVYSRSKFWGTTTLYGLKVNGKSRKPTACFVRVTFLKSVAVLLSLSATMTIKSILLFL